MQRNPEDGFSGSTDSLGAWPTSQYAFPVTVMIGAPINFSFLSELV